MMTKDWKHQNDLIFTQPSNLRFVAGEHNHAAIEVHAPRKHGMDVVVIAAAILGIILGIYFA